MQAFTDNKERTWEVAITIGSVKRIKALTGVDLFALDEGDPPLFTRLGVDAVLLCDVVCAIIRPQLQQADISDEAFAEGLAGDAATRMCAAFWKDLATFFRSLNRLDLVQAIEKQAEMILKAVAKVKANVEKIDAEKIVDEIVDEIFENSLADGQGSSA